MTWYLVKHRDNFTLPRNDYTTRISGLEECTVGKQAWWFLPGISCWFCIHQY